jgi:single-stranded DNA-specific DHH superfamily exonuclease
MASWQDDAQWKKHLLTAQNFLQTIDTFNKIAFIFHGDHDGCAAASILWEYIKEFYGKVPNIIVPLIKGPYTITKDLTQKFSRLKADFIAILDLPVERKPTEVQKLQEASNANLFILDHHKADISIDLPNCFYFNSRILQPDMENAPPPCYFVYHIYRNMKGVKDLCWIAGAGIIGDVCVEPCKDVIEEVKLHYSYLYPFKEINQELAWSSKLGELTKLVNSGRFYGENGPKVVLDAIIEAIAQNNPLFLFGDNPLASKIRQFREEIDMEVARELKLAKNKSKIISNLNLLIYETSAKMNIENALVSNLRALYPNYIVLLLSHKDDKIIFELRRSKSMIDLTELIKVALKNLKQASGGGHPPAGGGIILKKDLPTFLNRVKNYIDQFLKEGR